MEVSDDNLNFIAALALHQAKRDKAIGLTHVTKSQKGLIWYYNVKKQELFNQLSIEAFFNSIKQETSQRITEIMKAIQQSKSHEESMRLLLEAQALEKVLENIIRD